MFPDMPDELREALQERAERAQLEAIEQHLRMESFIFTMSKEDLHTFSQLLNVIIDDKRMGPYFQGMADALIRERFKLCPEHMVNHDDESLAEAAEEVRATVMVDNMRKYNLVAAGHDESDGYRCRKCNYFYPTIEDRMLKAPEECPGCEVKAKFG